MKNTQKQPQGITKQEKSRWKNLFLIVLAASIVVAYISNTLAVNKLVIQNEAMRSQKEDLEQANELLRSKVIRMQEAERIISIAKERLGMEEAKEAPKIITQ